MLLHADTNIFSKIQVQTPSESKTAEPKGGSKENNENSVEEKLHQIPEASKAGIAVSNGEPISQDPNWYKALDQEKVLSFKEIY